MTLEKSYEPAALEASCYQRWETAGYFKASGSGSPYCIMIPPPNVTGTLHMGHAFQQTLMDILIRYHRMKGDNTFWQVGTDHAGIATQMVVERQLLAAGQSRQAMGREAFVEKIWDWKKKSGGQITQQLRRMGASVDWTKERFTLDEGLSEAVSKVFIQLYDEGLIYRGQRLVHWDPVLQTAVSDLEVLAEEEAGTLWHIRYHLEIPQSTHTHITVATTRPETLLGDVAVAVHPEDPRYKALIGCMLQLPLCDRLIPIIGDRMVDPDFGTGCVKITPAHDFNDDEMGKRHDLPRINIFTKTATLNDQVPAPYRGLDRFEARTRILADLQIQGLLEKTEPHTLRTPRGDKSGAILEPLLTDQWFVKVQSLAEPAIQAVETGQIRFVPENWSKTYFEWMHNIQDWCISRQLWWGHRIPAWYDASGKHYVGQDEATVREKYQLDLAFPLHQDEDVLDTWFSSALWPFSTLGWPEKTADLQTFYPTQVLVTGFDIIFFWVARMIMFGLKFTGQVPFHEVYIHGLIQDHLGQKMSKTKGNGIDPLDVIDGISLEDLLKKRTHGLMQPQLALQIEKSTRTEFPKGIAAYGTDALRFTFAGLATSARHIRFDLARVESNKHFCNKLWNAARYVLMHTEDVDLDWQNAPVIGSLAAQSSLLHPVNRWIISLWQDLKKTIEIQLKDYRFDLAAQALYGFMWNEYCDWYVESSKALLNPNTYADPKIALETRRTLLSIFEEALRVMHPFMPYMTEALWETMAPLCQIHAPTIMLQPYPMPNPEAIDQEAIDAMDWLKAVILAIRNIRGETQIAPSKKIALILSQGSILDKSRVQKFEPLLYSLAKIETITWVEAATLDKNQGYATATVGDLTLFIPLAGLVDQAAENERLAKQLQKIQLEHEKLSQKLSNQGFVDRAPPTIVSQEQARLEELQKAIEKLKS